MPAYQYSTHEVYNPFIQASIKAKMGKDYIYNGRLFAQVKTQGEISYVDFLYQLNVRLVSWTTDTIDVELEVKDFSEKECYGIHGNVCSRIVNSVSDLVGTSVYVKVNNAGHILKVYNLADLARALNINILSENDARNLLVANPILSAFLCGNMELQPAHKSYSSYIIPSLTVDSELKVSSKKQLFNKGIGTSVATRQVFLNKEGLLSIAKNSAYNLNTEATSRRGIGNVLPYSIRYTAEETYGDRESVFFSVGIEKVVQRHDLNFAERLYSFFLRKISLVFKM